MEFWGLEVKPGSTVKCEPGHGFILHLSQAALGESKKSDNALMYVKVDDQKLAIGTLSIDKFPQVQFDLVFDKEFELSHTSKTTSVFFSGYKVEQPMEEDEMDLDSEDEEELDVPVIKENGKADGKEQKSQEKAVAAASKSSLVSKKSKDDDDSDEDETDDSDSDDTDDSDEGEGLSPEEGDDDDSSDEDDTSDDEEEETPTPKKKPEAGKKRPAENSLTPLSDKKAKVATPSAQKTGGKKGAVHVATPHPAKGKTPANNDKSKEKSPKSGGSVPCKSCTKTFNSEMALQAHSKAKHGAK
ncbi:hypothetical protein BDA96_09G223500 [Sorghum bicolor]|uniref:C2H2-type domain-containing protein n=2 Tax=Sorghum bicolor TaxID=4558 RepID=A0A921U5F1_SORBI|nr:histone deacetylase HDT2 [Sorghum bicolor]EES19871.1 hypothetical protein SORBI_3009G211700 [Sorghum bicolor]KAG0518968.1 hypothetical protein BDA96_09G223500 [Sorghum bicolor]|eukprot:XP_002441441.1 histone deacetylase HDT2 [Sorghum bicolor]